MIRNVSSLLYTGSAARCRILKGRMSSKPRMWSAWPCVNRMASSRPSPTRSACWRKSGVVSMTTFCPLRESSIEGRNRLSRGSSERHTRHGQPSVGTPMDVPEPRTVIVSGAEGMVKAPESTVTRYRVTAPGILGARLGFSFRRLCRNRLIDLQVGHLQLAEEVQEEVVFFRCKIAFGFFVQGVEHVNQLACGLGINHRLAGAWVGGAAVVFAASAGAAGLFAASRFASRSTSSAISLRNSPSEVKGRRSITRNESSCLWSDKVLSSAMQLRFSLSRVANLSRRGCGPGAPGACQRCGGTVKWNV